ncbi:hypothetical protein E5A73_12325 [Sphingomonas gei]|uniref:Terminase small subunit n=1 Tax=Sphingomonas gei TaxID=1395960 RepID=A0A4S1XD46_9SPHN|nr:hypothetical protein [Sphingomonas gei]TGX53603.1 hypothetical protein E5A73_12325 [Sphingomonas gei]
MSKRSDPAAFARAAGAADPVTLADPAPAPDPAPPPESANALAVADDDDAPLDYDPADYRWVPVRRIPRTDGWTEEKQRRFIETLADTGLVNLAARAVGMSRESAYRLRRSAHGAAFARAWDAARQHAGGLIEDIAFERAIEGVEHEVYNECGEVVGARLVHDNRLLKYLLSHLKPERYGTRNGEGRAPAMPAPAAPAEAPPALEESLRAMEPALPAPPEQLLAPEDLAAALELAEMADGVLPHFLSEQRPPRSDAQTAAEEAEARHARGAAAMAREEAGEALTEEESADQCFYLDPVSNARRRRRSR